jgi:hypothetical protein
MEYSRSRQARQLVVLEAAEDDDAQTAKAEATRTQAELIQRQLELRIVTDVAAALYVQWEEAIEQQARYTKQLGEHTDTAAEEYKRILNNPAQTRENRARAARAQRRTANKETVQRVLELRESQRNTDRLQAEYAAQNDRYTAALDDKTAAETVYNLASATAEDADKTKEATAARVVAFNKATAELQAALNEAESQEKKNTALRLAAELQAALNEAESQEKKAAALRLAAIRTLSAARVARAQEEADAQATERKKLLATQATLQATAATNARSDALNSPVRISFFEILLDPSDAAPDLREQQLFEAEKLAEASYSADRNSDVANARRQQAAAARDLRARNLAARTQNATRAAARARERARASARAAAKARERASARAREDLANAAAVARSDVPVAPADPESYVPTRYQPFAPDEASMQSLIRAALGPPPSASSIFLSQPGNLAAERLQYLPKDTINGLPSPLWFVDDGAPANKHDTVNRAFNDAEYAAANRFPNQSTFGEADFVDNQRIEYRVATHMEASMTGVRVAAGERALLYVKFPRSTKGKTVIRAHPRTVIPKTWKIDRLNSMSFPPGTYGVFKVRRSWLQPGRRTGWLVV